MPEKWTKLQKQHRRPLCKPVLPCPCEQSKKFICGGLTFPSRVSSGRLLRPNLKPAGRAEDPHAPHYGSHQDNPSFKYLKPHMDQRLESPGLSLHLPDRDPSGPDLDWDNPSDQDTPVERWEDIMSEVLAWKWIQRYREISLLVWEEWQAHQAAGRDVGSFSDWLWHQIEKGQDLLQKLYGCQSAVGSNGTELEVKQWRAVFANLQYALMRLRNRLDLLLGGPECLSPEYFILT